MEIEYFCGTRDDNDIIDLYKALKWYGLDGYTDEEIERANRNSFYSVYAYDGLALVGLGHVASDGLTAAVMSGICVRPDYRRRGIGEEIVTRLVYYCQSGANKLNVQLFCEDSLIHWYEKQGFEKHVCGMWKKMVLPEDNCRLRRNFKEVYGIEQISDITPDFYWSDLDSFGDFRYYSSINRRGEMVPCVMMTFYCNDPAAFSAEIIFENVSGFRIACQGVKTPLENFDIVKFQSDDGDVQGYKAYFKGNDAGFGCESFRVMNVNIEEKK